MHSAGVTVRGLRQMSGETHFSEVFLDGVALDADALIGPEGEGWPVASTTLVHERTTAILSRHATTLAAASALLDLGSGAAPAQRDEAVALWIEAQLLRLSGYRGVAEAHAGQPSAASYIQRLQWGLLNRRIFEVGVNLTGCFEDHVWTTLFLTSRGWTIGGGTSEIQRNMLAEKVLGLPRR
jgi:alkylation response protein AidB-like acyl-CoA dehydrogenase